MSRWPRIALAAVLAVGLVAVTAGCGGSDSISDVDEGQSFSMGELRWNVLYDRELNAAQVEDGDYLSGAPAAGADETYFAIFVLVENEGGDPVTLPERSDFKVTDSTSETGGPTYEPLESDSLFSFPFGESIEPDEEVPRPDSVAADGPTQGSMLLFGLSADVSENRPLDLEIESQGETAKIELDL